MRTAFKEWVVVVDALERGEQIIILRKGGIHEGRGGFKPEHSRFWLFPTLFHQQRESVLPGAQRRFDEIGPFLASTDRARISSFGEVIDARRIDSLDAAQALQGQHVWTHEVIAQRFEWGREKNIFALGVRVFRLPKPFELQMAPTYGGCKSWIELESAPGIDGAVPVLSDAAFGAKLNVFRAALQNFALAQ